MDGKEGKEEKALRAKAGVRSNTARALVGGDGEVINKFDENADGIVDNDEFIKGTYGAADYIASESPGGGDVTNWDKPQPWSTRDVFNTLEQDSTSILPDVVPGFLQQVADYAVSPNEPWKKIWNAVVLAAVLASAFMVPFESAFTPDSDGAWYDLVIDFIFYIDICLNFFTGEHSCQPPAPHRTRLIHLKRAVQRLW